MKSHPTPKLPWTQVSADIFEWNDLKYLVIVDVYSGWFEIDTLWNMLSKTVIMKMKRHFAVHGVPELLMTDNGTQFVSEEFKLFAKDWSFKQVTSSPTYPHSNGLAKNAVKQAKKLLEKSKRDGSDPILGLLNLRNMPRDDSLGSSAQRLHLHSNRTPKVIPCKQVSQRICRK
jgi:transposase InsO family protein